MIVDTKKKTKNKLVVLKSKIDESQIQAIIDNNKTKPFRHLLRTPKPDEVHVKQEEMTVKKLGKILDEEY